MLWGVAAASYQIEGGVHEGGRGPSIWDTFSHTPGRTLNGDTGDVACDHYHLFKDDIAIMKQLGVNTYRLSVAWPRIQPTGSGAANQAGIDFYARVIDALREADITPMVTLYHWDLPQALEDQGGWPARDTALRFADYADIMVRALGDRVDLWTTLNEPWCSAFLGYAAGEHAPGIQSPLASLRAAHHLNLAHGLATQAMRAAGTASTKVSVVLNLQAITPATDDPADVAAWARADACGNGIWTGPMLDGAYPQALFDATSEITDWAFIADDDVRDIHQPLDSLGINFYMTHQLKAGQPGAAKPTAPTPWVGAEDVVFLPDQGPLTDMGWNIDPEGMTRILVDCHQKWPDLPLMITENGSAWPDTVEADGSIHDTERVDYLSRHVEALAEARRQGVPVAGYFAWSVMDNFEWAWGYTKRFGLVHVDYPTQTRRIKDSGWKYRELVAGYQGK
jgi:beta-glucosidase